MTLLSTPRGRRYDFKYIFAEKFTEKNWHFDQKILLAFTKNDHTIGFREKRQYFSTKVAKIAEKNDPNNIFLRFLLFFRKIMILTSTPGERLHQHRADEAGHPGRSGRDPDRRRLQEVRRHDGPLSKLGAGEIIVVI
jgi:hypothetical protein